jgi:hypothetical protein
MLQQGIDQSRPVRVPFVFPEGLLEALIDDTGILHDVTDVPLWCKGCNRLRADFHSVRAGHNQVWFGMEQ